jgi:hypothetical protein
MIRIEPFQRLLKRAKAALASERCAQARRDLLHQSRQAVRMPGNLRGGIRVKHGQFPSQGLRGLLEGSLGLLPSRRRLLHDPV